MKIKAGLCLREVAGESVVVSVGADLDFDGMITLNDTAAFLFRALSCEREEGELIRLLLDEYEVDEATARAAVQSFTAKLSEMDFLD